MSADNFNPYQPPAADQTDVHPRPGRPEQLMIGVSWVCSVLVTGYGLIGTFANGADLLRTQSSSDLIKELQLLAMFGLGLYVGWKTYDAMKNRRTDVIPRVTVLAIAGSGWVLYDLM